MNTCTKRNTIVAAVLAVIHLCLLAEQALAIPVITNVTARQRYPWNGKVDILYTASGDIEESAQDKGLLPVLKVTATDLMSDYAYTASTLSGDMALSDGTHNIVWDMDADELDLKSTNVIFSVTCATEPVCDILANSCLNLGLSSVRSLIANMGGSEFAESYDVGTIVELDVSSVPDYAGEYKNDAYFTVVSNSLPLNPVGLVDVQVYAISLHKASGIRKTVRSTCSVVFSSLSNFMVFYSRDLEMWPGENMAIKGKVHTNGDLFVGSDKLLRFENNVTAHGKFYAGRKPDSGFWGNNAYVTTQNRVQFRKGDDANYPQGYKNTELVDVIRQDDNGTKRMDSAGLGANWATESEIYYGGAVRTDQPTVPIPIKGTDDGHAIIERCRAASDPLYNQDVETAKFASKAALTIRIDADGNLHLYAGKYVPGSFANEIPNPERLMQPAASVSKPTNSANGNYNVVQNSFTYTEGDGEDAHEVITDPLPAYQVENAIYDRRDDRAKAVVDIYVDQLLNNPTLRNYLYPETSSASGGGGGDSTTDDREPGVLYVTRDEPLGYPMITTMQHGTGLYQTTGTDTKTTTSETEKNTLLENGYTLASTSTTTKYYYNGREITQQQYNQYIQDSRSKRYCSTQTVTTYTLIKPIQTEIMETFAVTNYIPVEPAVRIRNASDLTIARSDDRPGLSIVTDLPLYIEGSYNTNGQRGNANDNCLDKPAALVAADAVTMLSSNWRDEWRTPNWAGWDGNNPSSVRPAENLSTRIAAETTFNGIVMTGIVESRGGTYSGGLHNIFRFHENWRPSGTCPYNFNGSIVCIWTSRIANRPIEGSYTYQSPSRPWSWARMDPPGLPQLLDMQISSVEDVSDSECGEKSFSFCEGESVPTGIDLEAGVRQAKAVEPIVYSFEWSTDVDVAGEGEAIVEVNGEPIVDATGFGVVEWRPMRNGTYDFTHRVLADGAQIGETLTATFVVGHFPETPVIFPANGTTFNSTLSVSMSCPTEGTIIHYTTDGTEPNEASPIYRRFRVTSRTVVKAVAIKDGFLSEVAVAEYAPGQCAAPVITPADGTEFEHVGQSVAIAWQGADGVLRYTTDGSDPTAESPVYTGPFTIDYSTVVKAKAFGDQYFDSAIATANLTRVWATVATPTIAAASSFTGSETKVSLSCATTGATIRYTLDGSDPNSHATRYTGPFYVADSCTVKAYATCYDYLDSAVATQSITKVWGIGDTVGASDHTFATGGDLPFVRVTDSTAPLGESMKSGAITHSQTSTLSTTVMGPGTISFQWKTSCEDSGGEYDWDHVEFWVDDTRIAQLDGETAWQTVTQAISDDGSHTLLWKYVKDDMSSEGEDCCWVADYHWASAYTATQTTPAHVPYLWLRTYFPETPDEYDFYEAAAKEDAANGVNKVWECYVAGLAPTNAMDVFRTVISMNGETPVIGWEPDLNEGGTKQERVYTVEGKENLTDSWAPTNAASSFFRVKVEMP